MAKTEQPEQGTPVIEPGTKEMEAFLQVGYPGMTVEKAKMIIKERKENPALWPYESVEKAEAFLAAYNAKARPISTDPGWKRTEQ